MRTRIPSGTVLSCVLLFVLFAGVSNASAHSGREYWIAIPPNEHDGAYPAIDLEIYVTSAFDTPVTLAHPGSGFTITKQVKAGVTTTFTTVDNSANWSWELRDDERPAAQGIRITADQPVSVSVLNSKQVSSDGYTAIPTDKWGTEYIHLGFYDFGEFASTSPWGGGFVVVAKENNTKVQFTLRGVDNGNPSARTKKDKRLGSIVSVTLQQGQTYLLRGNGQTLNEFDISGTQIVANKPIGLFSFHQRTMIPSFPSPNNGRNHLVEMMTPINAWGTEHVSLELARDGNRGDFFRIVAKEDLTQFQCRYTDLVTGETYTWEGLLAHAGDFMEKENTWPPSTSIRGVAVWTSNKPTLVMQYSYSGAWDSSPDWDPFMVNVIPTNQFVNSSTFSAPTNVEFVNNYLSIIAVGDPDDPEQEKLRSIRVDGVPLWETQPDIITNRIQQTPYYWARIKVAPGAHTIAGDTEFSATLHGVSAFSGYGWPVAASLAAIPTDVREDKTGADLVLTTEPNPLTETLRVRYTLAASADVSLELYTATGEQVRVLDRGYKAAGAHVCEVSASDLPSGVYMCRLMSAGEMVTQKVCVVK